MNKKNAPSLKNLEIIYLSFFGSGFLPRAPGTWGSIATLPLLYALNLLKVPTLFVLPTLIFTIIGTCLLTEMVQKKYNLHDPQWIVIDEVLGMVTAWIFTLGYPANSSLLIILVYFRFFDIYKFWPASYFDKLEHGMGTILDDIVSGVFAGVAFVFTQWAINYFQM